MKFDELLYFIKFHQISSSFIKFHQISSTLFISDIFLKQMIQRNSYQELMNIIFNSSLNNIIFLFIIFNSFLNKIIFVYIIFKLNVYKTILSIFYLI